MRIESWGADVKLCNSIWVNVKLIIGQKPVKTRSETSSMVSMVMLINAQLPTTTFQNSIRISEILQLHLLNRNNYYLLANHEINVERDKCFYPANKLSARSQTQWIRKQVDPQINLNLVRLVLRHRILLKRQATSPQLMISEASVTNMLHNQ